MRPASAAIIFFLSGVAGLGDQIVWVRMFAVGLGHEVPSLLAVVGAFFVGLALGAYGLDRAVSTSARPARWYALLEAVIGAWALATIFLIPRAAEWLAHALGPDPAPARQWALSFLVPMLILLPATTAMGATLSAMDRVYARLRARWRAVGAVYGANTLGAVAGTLLTAFLLMELLGYRATLAALASCNLLGTIGALFILAPGETERAEAAPPEPIAAAHAARPRWLLTLFVTGLLGIGYEVLAVRVLAQVLENTVYSFAAALSIYLLGTAIGAAVYQSLPPRLEPRRLLAWLLGGLSASVLLGIGALRLAPSIYEPLRAALGGAAAGAITAELALAAAVFLVPTLLMGATFSHLAQLCRGMEGGVGRALAVNTLGACLAPPLFGVLLLPMLGAKWSIALIAIGYAASLPDWRPRRLAPLILPAGLAAAALPGALVLVEPLPGGRIIEYREGVLGAVAVVTDADEERYLKVNNKFLMGGTRSPFLDKRMAHIPLLLHPAPRRALFLGLGTGSTFAAVADHPGVSGVGVELVPEVVGVMPLFEEVNGALRSSERMRTITADARRFVRSEESVFDVIVADLFHPARDGAGTLYTREHFGAIRARLTDTGLFCQWLPLHQLDPPTLRLILRTFLDIFPDAVAFIGDFNTRTPALGLLGGAPAGGFDARWYQLRVQDPALEATLRELALRDSVTLFGCFIGDAAALRAFAGDGPLNTDDRPLVVFQAPRSVYRAEYSGYGTLRSVIESVPGGAAQIIEQDGQPWTNIVSTRLNAFLAARSLYLQGAIALAEGDSESALDYFIRSIAASPDFRLAYDAAFQWAESLIMTDTAMCRRIVEALAAASPQRPEATEALKALNAAAPTPP